MRQMTNRASPKFFALSTLPHVRELTTCYSQVGESEFNLICRLADLETLCIDNALFQYHKYPNLLDLDSRKAAGVRTPSAANLRCLGRLQSLRSITLLLPSFLDASVLEVWSKLPKLQELRLPNHNLKNYKLQALGKFVHLRELQFRGESDPAKAPVISALPIASWREMRSLAIANVELTPDELRAITHLPNLESLELDDTGIGDAELAILHSMKRLKKLRIFMHRATPEGIQALKAAVPSLSIGPR